MIVILIFSVLTVFTAGFCWILIKSHKVIADLDDVSPTIHEYFVPILSCGKKVRAFTIENINFFHCNKSYVIPWPLYICDKVKTLFSSKENKLEYIIINKIMLYNELNLMKKAVDANYMIVARHQVLKRDRLINIISSAVAIYKYKDTLPIFALDHRGLLHLQQPISCSIAAHYACAILLLIPIMMLSYSIPYHIGRYYATHFSSDDKAALWSYVVDEIDALSVEKVELQNIEKNLNLIASNIAAAAGLESNENIHVHIYEDSNVGAYLYPGGHVVLSSALIQHIDSLNQATFIIANLLWHNNNNSIFSKLNFNALNMRFYINYFGPNSIVKYLIWRSHFHTPFTIEEEMKADNFAISILEKLYHNIYGYEILSNQAINSEAFHHYNDRFDYIKNNLLPSQKYLEHLKIPIKEINAKDENYDDKKIERLDASNIEDLISQYNNISREFILGYYAILSSYNLVLDLDNTIIKDDLKYRIEFLDQGIDHVINKQAEFHKIYEDYVFKIISISKNNKEIDKAQLINNSQHLYSSINKMIQHDIKVLTESKIVIKFIYTRYNSIYFQKNNVLKFQTVKEQDDYIALQKRIDKMLQYRSTLRNQIGIK